MKNSMHFINDYLDFAAKYNKLIENNASFNNNELVKKLIIRFQKADIGHMPYWSSCKDSPFFSSGVIEFNNGEKRIGYNETIINDVNLTEIEQHSLILHEIGHFIFPCQTREDNENSQIEIHCDEFSRQIIGSSAIISALEKLQSLSPEDKATSIRKRISVLQIGEKRDKMGGGILIN